MAQHAAGFGVGARRDNLAGAEAARPRRAARRGWSFRARAWIAGSSFDDGALRHFDGHPNDLGRGFGPRRMSLFCRTLPPGLLAKDWGRATVQLAMPIATSRSMEPGEYGLGGLRFTARLRRLRDPGGSTRRGPWPAKGRKRVDAGGSGLEGVGS